MSMDFSDLVQAPSALDFSDLAQKPAATPTAPTGGPQPLSKEEMERYTQYALRTTAAGPAFSAQEKSDFDALRARQMATAAPMSATERVAGRALQGFAEGSMFTNPLDALAEKRTEPQSKVESYAQFGARTAGQIAGWTLGIGGRILSPVVAAGFESAGILGATAAGQSINVARLANRLGPVIAGKIAPYLDMAVQAGGEGAAFQLYDTLINERAKLDKMDLPEATMYVLKRSGLTAASWATMVPAIHGLLQGLKWLPAHDARLNPEAYDTTGPINPVETHTIQPSRVNIPALVTGAQSVEHTQVIADVAGRATRDAVAPELGILKTGMREAFQPQIDEATDALQQLSVKLGANPRAAGTNPRAIGQIIQSMKAKGVSDEEITRYVQSYREARAKGVVPGQTDLPGVEGGAGPSVGDILRSERGSVILYRGSTGAQGGEWWTTNPQRAASHGEVTEAVSVPDEVFQRGAATAREQGSGTSGDAILPPEWSSKSRFVNLARQVYDVSSQALGNERGAILLGPGGVEQGPTNLVRSRRELQNLGVIGASRMMDGITTRSDWEPALYSYLEANGLGQHRAEIASSIDKIWAESSRIYEKTMADTAGQLAGVTRLSELLAKGEAGAEWYPILRKQLSTLVLPQYEEPFMRYLALTSKSNNVGNNVKLAVKAFVQDQLGLPARGLFFSNAEVAKYRAGENPGGIKIDDFARAPFDDSIVVVDRRMMRLFGYKEDVPTDIQREVIKQRVTELSQKMGLTPRETQAMLWVGYGKDPQFLKNFAEGRAPTGENFVEYLSHNPALKARVQLALQSKEPVPITAMDLQQLHNSGNPYAIIGSEPGDGLKTKVLSGENNVMALQRRIAESGIDPAKVMQLRGRWIDPASKAVVDGETSYLIRDLGAKEAQAIARDQGQTAFITERGMVDTSTGLVRPATGKMTFGPEAILNPEGHSIVDTVNGPLPFAMEYAPDPVGYLRELAPLAGMQQLTEKAVGPKEPITVVMNYDHAQGRFVPKDGGEIPPELSGALEHASENFQRASFQHQLMTGEPLRDGSLELKINPVSGGENEPIVKASQQQGLFGKSFPKNVEVHAPWFDMVKEMAASNLLGLVPKALLIKTASETMGLIGEPLSKIATGRVREAGYDIFGKVAYLPSAVSKLAQALTTATEGAIPGAAGQVIRMPFRLLDAGMQFMQELNRGGGIYSNAFRIASEEKAPDMAGRVAELIAHPTTDMVQAAERQAKYYTFQSDMGSFAKKLQDLARTNELRPLAWFFKVPVNAMKMGIDYSPLGFAELGGDMIRAKRAGTLVGDAQDRLGRAIVGSTVAAAAYMLAARGYITGQGPTNPDMQRNLKAQGWMPFSLKVGDKYIDYDRWKPLSPVLAGAASLAESFHDENDGAAVANRMTQFVMHEIDQMPFLFSLSDFFKAADSSQSAGDKMIEGAANLVTAPLVNANIRDIARGMDPYERSSKGIIQTMQAKLPVLREQLPQQQDVLGRPVPAEYLGIPWVGKAHTSRDDPILQELYRLGLPLPQVAAKHISKVTGQQEERPQDELFAMRSERGQRYVEFLNHLISSPGYSNLPDDNKRVLMRKYIQRIEAMRSEVNPSAR